MPFALLAAAMIGSSVIGGIGQGVAASEQASAQEDAIALQKQIWQQTQQNLAPFIGAGPGAVSNLQTGIGTATQPGPWSKPFDWSQIANNPAYKFILGQGEQAITDQASATGGIGGGNTLKELMNYGQGAAAQFGNMLFGENLATQNQQFGQAFNLASLAENAAAGQGSIGAQTGSNIADSFSNLGMAQASGVGGITGGIQSLLNSNAFSQLLNAGGGFSGGQDFQIMPTPTDAGQLWSSLFTPNP